MSDYLWDKSGEPEDDVAQLEKLLGTLKYQPRPLDIPATAIPTTAAAQARTSTIFSRPRLALAASLVLTLLAGAWLITRVGERPQEQLAEVKQSSPASESKRAETAVVTKTESHAAVVTNTENHTAAPGVLNNSVRFNKSRSFGQQRGFARVKSRENRTVAVVASAARGNQRTGRQSSADRRQKLRSRAGENAPREEIAEGAMRWQVEQPLTPQQREATEQLMLALRLASAKLNYAQREMQEIGRAGK